VWGKAAVAAHNDQVSGLRTTKGKTNGKACHNDYTNTRGPGQARGLTAAAAQTEVYDTVGDERGAAGTDHGRESWPGPPPRRASRAKSCKRPSYI